ncbi:alpha/beta hydrolase [Halomonas sp. SSL-5]|uniref:alpha/beta fold hydrolase n=1 Tax=Halomonas sp. SSL-5 TaxID=3065855 RepID=UPI002739F5D1|nr:alpha/beta hydrolase [Halomonas sp. SSL-5]MDY7115149.1 alpha/beta hydrolase [Halomonas sp. SSL-5]
MRLPEDDIPRRRRRPLWVLPSLLLGMLLSGCSALERQHEALLVLGDLAAGEGPSRLKQRTPPPERERLAYAVAGRDYLADLYRPETSRRGTLILVHGLTEAGRRDPRLMALARSLARAGFTVLVPELDGLRDFSVGTREVQGIADAIRYASDALATTDGGPALAAISFATGPALLAAMQPDTAHRVRFVIAVGGYYDLTDLLRYATTGEDRGSACRRPPPPQRDVRWAVLRSQLHALEDAQDRERLAAIARARLAGEEAADPDTSELSPEAMALYALVTNRDPARVTPLLGALPPPLLAQFTALDLASRDLDALEARLVLIHGPDDRVIPVSHSRRLRAALPAGQARLFEAEGLGHVEVSANWRDAWTLWRAIHHVLWLGEDADTKR